MNRLSATPPAPSVIVGVLFSTITDEVGNMVATAYGLTESECNHRARCVLTHHLLVTVLGRIANGETVNAKGEAQAALDSLKPAPRGWESV